LYILSKKSVEKLKDNKIPDPYNDLLFEDIYVSQILLNNNILLHSYNIYTNNYNEFINNDYIGWHNYNKSKYEEFNLIK